MNFIMKCCSLSEVLIYRSFLTLSILHQRCIQWQNRHLRTSNSIFKIQMNTSNIFFCVVFILKVLHCIDLSMSYVPIFVPIPQLIVTYFKLYFSTCVWRKKLTFCGFCVLDRYERIYKGQNTKQFLLFNFAENI